MNFYIANKNGTYVKSSGHILGKDLIAHKATLGDWRISDINSGAMVKGGLKSLKQCKEAFATIPEDILSEINRIRTTDKYKAHCEKVLAYIKENGI